MPLKTNHLKPLARPLLLDSVPSAAAAYSLRQLSNAYTGPVVTVRRSSDNAEADFKASEIDDGTLAAFCGAGDGFVKTWFDQSGNTGRDASQGAAVSQPKIVDSGSVVLEEGKPAIQFDGTSDYLALAGISNDSSWSVFSVTRRQASGKSMLALGGSASGDVSHPAFEFTDNKSYSRNSVGYKVYNSATVEQVLCATINKSDSDHTQIDTYRNGVLLLADSIVLLAGTNTWNAIGTRTGSRSAGTMQEIVVYLLDQSANRQRIEGNIAWYY